MHPQALWPLQDPSAKNPHALSHLTLPEFKDVQIPNDLTKCHCFKFEQGEKDALLLLLLQTISLPANRDSSSVAAWPQSQSEDARDRTPSEFHLSGVDGQRASSARRLLARIENGCAAGKCQQHAQHFETLLMR